MTFLVLGLNHRSASVSLRERLAIDRDGLASSLERLLKFIDRGLILSTCNRLEIYTFGKGAQLSDQICEFLNDYSGVTGPELATHYYSYEEGDCVKHLFRVAAGLDSMVIGEREVLGQVRAAYSIATQQGTVKGPLSWLFHRGLRVGRRIHRETDIGHASNSTSRIAVQLARSVLGDLYQQNALVIGVGDAGRLAGRALADAGVRNIAVTNRTYSRAVDLAGDLGGAAVSFDELPQHLNHADVVITSTASPGYVLDRDAVNEAISSRNGRPLLLIDIAVPRDIDPLVGELGNVWLYDIDALQLMTEPATEVMEREIARAELIADEETDRFLEWWDSLGAVPLVTAIRGKAEDIRRAEVAKYLKKLRGQWPPDTAQVLEAMTISLVKKLLHSPTAYLRGGQDPELQQLAWKLFNIGGGERRGRK